MKNKSYFFSENIYHRNYHIIMGNRIYAKYIFKKYYNHDYDGSQALGCMGGYKNIQTKKYNTIIWCSKYCVSNLIHEITHAVLTTMEYIQMPNESSAQEAYCYYHQWLFRAIIEATGYKNWKI